MYEIEIYETESGRSPIKDYMADLGKNNKQQELAKINVYIKRLEQYGMAVNQEYPETIRNLKEDIYELRPGKNRIFFFYLVGNKFVLLHAYRKHSQKAPQKEIEKAIKEKKDYIRRQKK